MAADEPKRVLGPGATCCGEGCGLVGCEPSEPVAPKKAAKTLDLTDDMTGEDK